MLPPVCARSHAKVGTDLASCQRHLFTRDRVERLGSVLQTNLRPKMFATNETCRPYTGRKLRMDVEMDSSQVLIATLILAVLGQHVAQRIGQRTSPSSSTGNERGPHALYDAG